MNSGNPSCPDPSEDGKLSLERQVLANVAQLELYVNSARNRLTQGTGSSEVAPVVDLLQNSLAEVERAARLDGRLSQWCDLLRAGLTGIEEAAIGLRRYSDSLETNPEVLAQVEARLAVLASIKRKYGPTIEDAIACRDRLAEELERLENAQSTINHLTDELGRLDAQAEDRCGVLSTARKHLAKQLALNVEQELSLLGMERCRFDIVFEDQAEMGTTGKDRVEFMIAPNPGQPAMPVQNRLRRRAIQGYAGH